MFLLLQNFLGRVLEGPHASYVEKVPYKYIAIFTIFQVVYLMICFGVTWIPIGGILFPVPFFLLISIREHLLPKLFHPHHLQELDASEYEEIAGAPHRNRSISLTVMLIFPFICQFYFLLSLVIIKKSLSNVDQLVQHQSQKLKLFGSVAPLQYQARTQFIIPKKFSHISMKN